MSTILARYKQTEVGAIPEDWEVVRLGIYSEITKLAGFEYTSHFNGYKDGGDIVVVRGTNITHNYLDLTDVRTIPKSTSDKLPRSKLNKGDLVFAYVGTIGPVFLIDENDKYHLGPNTARITCKDGLSPQFLFCYFTSDLIHNEIAERISTGAQPSLSMAKIRDFRLLRPTKAEQRAIAAALSDVDALLAKLDKLIAKKRDLKQAAMQQLLTGQTRLPGFDGAWEVKPFGEVLSRVNGKAYQIQSSDYQETGQHPVVDQGKEPVIGFSDRSDKVFHCSCEGVIVFGDHTCIVKFVDFDFVVGADGTQIMAGKNGQSARFHAYHLEHSGISTTGYNRHFKFVKEREFLAPTFAEQTAIATVLSDMDAEIAALEARRDKTRALKQGMMQELLTGRIRLV